MSTSWTPQTHSPSSPDCSRPSRRRDAVLATRRDLPLRLQRLRLAGELAEIRAADLRFRERETRELLEASGIGLSEAGAALLHQRTEGWAAGLRLAAIALAGHSDPERFVAEFSGSDRTVAEYLIAEMLERQPDDIKELLLRTSMLDRVNGELADCGRPPRLGTDSAGTRRRERVCESLDPERTWFRYHHLFGDLLRLELRRAMPEEVPGCIGRPLSGSPSMASSSTRSDIYRRRATGRRGPATRRLFVQPDPRRAAADHPGAVARLPAGCGSPRAGPRVQNGRCFQGRLDQAAAHLAVAEKYAETAPPDRRRRLKVAIETLKVSLARRRGHLAGGLEQAFLASPVTGQTGPDVALGSELRAVTLMNLGVVEGWSQGLPEAERHLLEGAGLARQIERPYLEVSCLTLLGYASKSARSPPPGSAVRRRSRSPLGTAGAPSHDRTRARHPGRQDDVDGRVRRRRAMAPAHRTDAANRRRAWHRTAAASGDREAVRRPRPPPRSLEEFARPNTCNRS